MGKIFEKVYHLVKRVPKGKVVTYGQVSEQIESCTPRIVGYAMAAVEDSDIPCQRVINSKGEVSPRAWGEAQITQQEILVEEGVMFNKTGKVDLKKFRFIFLELE